MLTRYLEMRRLARDGLVLPCPQLIYDLTAVDELLARIRADVECGAVDATVAYTPGSAAPFAFTDEQTGCALELDPEEVRDAVEKSLMKLAPGSMTLEVTVIEPQVYRAVLENSISLRARVVAQVTGGEAAMHNVQLAAQALCGLRVDSVETFSFNGAVGARTQESGYLAAPEPAYGENVSGVGGGV